jgi:hypothetical protein
MFNLKIFGGLLGRRCYVIALESLYAWAFRLEEDEISGVMPFAVKCIYQACYQYCYSALVG